MKNKILVLFLGFIVANCGSGDNGDASVFSERELLTDEVNQVILPLINDFVSAVQTLQSSTEVYISETNEVNLNQLKNHWKGAALGYERIYAFNIGEVRSLFLHQAIYAWPIATASIEDILMNNKITEEFLKPYSPQIKTLAAMEYLLFKSSVQEVNNEFETSDNRKAYLKWSAVFLKSQAERLQQVWSASGKNYADSFINNNATGIQGSFNLFFNGLHNLIDTGKVTKVGKPAGLENSKVVSPELTQAYFSDTSLEILEANLTSLSLAYFNPNGIGIDDYVFSITGDHVLNNLIKDKISEIQQTISAINEPLDQAIIANPASVKEIHTQLEELRVLFAVDLRSILSVVVTSTDNDGD